MGQATFSGLDSAPTTIHAMSDADSTSVLRPALAVLPGGRVASGVEIEVSGDRIVEVRDATSPADWNVCLLPGFVNAHSHAFQRGLRGLGESFPDGAGSFFTWRESMYALVESLDPDLCHAICRLAFEEMLDAGITAVGEFHYIHHGPETAFSLDAAVLQAAADVGIRIVLLHSDYVRGGFDDRPLAGGQRRFDTGSETDFVAACERAVRAASGPLQTVAPIVHSTRAVPIDRIERIRAAARSLGTPFHIHLEEVVAEVDDCRAAHGVTPMRLLLDRGVIDDRTTAIHCTHSTPEDLRDFASAGGTVCLCPNTEGNLGDGIPDLATMRAAGIPIAIGTDLNSRLSPAEDLRWIEYVQRIHRQMRGAVVDGNARIGGALLDIGTVNGARSLGLDAGEIAPGCFADFAAVDLEHRTLTGVSPAVILEAIITGTGPEAMAGTCVGGRWLRGGPGAC